MRSGSRDGPGPVPGIEYLALDRPQRDELFDDRLRSTDVPRRRRADRWRCGRRDRHRRSGWDPPDRSRQADQWHRGGDLAGTRARKLQRTACRGVGDRQKPVARSSQVRGSASTTLGGLPRLCAGPEMHWTATNGGTRTSTLDPGATAASVRAVSRTASAKSARGGSGAPSSRNQSAIAETASRVFAGSDYGSFLGRPYLRVSKCLSTATIPHTRWQAGSCGHRRGRGGLIFMQFRGDFTPRTELTMLSSRAGLVVEPGSKVTYNGVEIGRVGRIEHGRRGRQGEGEAVAGRRSGLHQVHPGQRDRRDPGHHGVRQQVHLVQFSGKPYRGTDFAPRHDRGPRSLRSSTRCSRR